MTKIVYRKPLSLAQKVEELEKLIDKISDKNFNKYFEPQPDGSLWLVLQINGNAITFEFNVDGTMAVESKLISPEVLTQIITFAKDQNLTYLIEDGGKLKLNGIPILDMFGTDLGVKNLNVRGGITLGGVERNSWPSSSTDPFRTGEEVHTIGIVHNLAKPTNDLYDTGEVDEIIKSTKQTIEDTYAKRANFDTQAGGDNKAIFNANGNEMEFKVGKLSPATLLLEKSGINMLNSQITKAVPAKKPTDLINKNEGENIAKKEVAEALATNEVEKDGATFTTKTGQGNSGKVNFNVLDAPTNYEYLFYTPDTGDYVITPNTDIYPDETIKFNEYAITFNFGGEFIDNLHKEVGVDTTSIDTYKQTTEIVNWLGKEKELNLSGRIVIPDKDNKGDNYDRYFLDLITTFTIEKESGKWLPKLGEFVFYTLKEIDKAGNEKPTIEGTQYLNDPDYSEDKTPIRIFASKVEWVKLGGVSVAPEWELIPELKEGVKATETDEGKYSIPLAKDYTAYNELTHLTFSYSNVSPDGIATLYQAISNNDHKINNLYSPAFLEISSTLEGDFKGIRFDKSCTIEIKPTEIVFDTKGLKPFLLAFTFPDDGVYIKK